MSKCSPINYSKRMGRLSNHKEEPFIAGAPHKTIAEREEQLYISSFLSSVCQVLLVVMGCMGIPKLVRSQSD